MSETETVKEPKAKTKATEAAPDWPIPAPPGSERIRGIVLVGKDLPIDGVNSASDRISARTESHVKGHDIYFVNAERRYVVRTFREHDMTKPVLVRYFHEARIEIATAWHDGPDVR